MYRPAFYSGYAEVSPETELVANADVAENLAATYHKMPTGETSVEKTRSHFQPIFQ